MASPGGREAGRVSVRVLPDTSRFAADLLGDLRRIESALHLTVPVHADLDAFSAEVRTRLAALRDETVRVRVDADDDGLTRIRSSLTALTQEGSAAGGPLGAVARSVANLRTAALTTVPNLAGLVAGLGQMAPAAGVAVTGLLAVATAGAAVKIGTAGVADALKGDAEAMAKLAPAARAFVTEVRDLRPAWDELRTSVQQRLFDGLADGVQRLATSALPILRNGLNTTATTLNTMAKGVAEAAAELGESGTLGNAVSSANIGLHNLARVPALVVRGLGQIAAAAGPSFERITAGAAGAAERVAQRLSEAFKSGRLQRTIDRAVALVGQLFRTLGNLGTAAGNIFGPAADAGAGFLGVLNEVSRTLAEVTGTAQAQEAFQALFETLAAAQGVISGVLGAGLEAALPLVSALVTALSGPLQQAFAALGPQLESLLGTLGSKGLGPAVQSLSRFLASLVPILTRVAVQSAQVLGPTLAAAGPLLGKIADALSTALLPLLKQYPAIIQPVLSTAGVLAEILIELGQELLSSVSPSLRNLGVSFGQVLAAAGPLLAALGQLVGGILAAAQPILSAVIALVGRLATLVAGVLSAYLTNILVPALKIVTSLLRGDFSGAWRQTQAVAVRVGNAFRAVFVKVGQWAAEGVQKVVSWLASLPGRAISAASSLGSRLQSLASSAWGRMESAAKSGTSAVLSWLRGMPGRAKSALGNLGNTLREAGRALMRGFLNGIKSMFGSIRGALAGLTDNLTDWKGPPPRDARILRPAGRLVMAGFTEGIASAVPTLRAQLQAITATVADYRPIVAARVEAAGLTFGEKPVSAAGPTVTIGTFVANQQQTPADIARELAWLAKARG